MNIRLASTPLKTKATRVVFEIASSTRSGGQTVGDLRSIELRRSGKERIETILTVSLGRKSRLTPETIRRACGAVVRFLEKHRVARAEIDLTAIPGFSPSASVTAVCEGLVLGAFQFRRHKSPPKDSRPTTVYLLVDRRTKSLASAVERALSIAEATNLAREWSHEPPNLVNPVTLAARVRILARNTGLKCAICNEKHLARMKAGALLAVGMASKSPPRLLVLEYSGKTRAKTVRPIVLVREGYYF